MTSNPGTLMTRFDKIKQGLFHEAKKFLAVSIYFAIWFFSISLITKMSLIQSGVEPTEIIYSFSFAVIRALIVAKFLITAELLFPMRIESGQPLLYPLIKHSLIYTAFLIFMGFVEKGFEGLLHRENFFEALQHFGHGDPKVIASIAFIYGLIVVHYLFYSALESRFGVVEMRKILFGHKE